MVDFPSPGAALVISSDLVRRSKSESRIELRRVRMASSKLVTAWSACRKP